MAPKAKSLVPAAKELALLSEPKVIALLALVDREGDRANKYATTAMYCGTASLLGCFALFGYLVMNGHEKAAALVFGTSVAGLIGKIILARL